MSKYSKFGRVAKCGSPDSKYMGRANALDEDVKAKLREREEFKKQLRHLVLLDPSKMDLRYKDLLEVAIELKQEFKL